ncbi:MULTISPECIES: DUF6364 family protein [Anaerotignum]|uniref:DUF6364 family protein n=1 Tax=Anaerotignum TaxID=2039240 RepID=UPI00210C8CB3|nr:MULTISPECIES: DUF6364 family protein [Anaerotignum]MCQ4935310.1 ribbon-helix-helix domain-containing protein [Anaerotignum propionicum]
MKPLKEKVSMTLDSDIIERIKELAEKDDRSFSQYVNLVLRRHLEKHEETSKS